MTNDTTADARADVRSIDLLLGEFYAAYRNGAPEALRLGESLIAQFPDLRGVRVKVVHLRLSGGQPMQALELAEASLERFAEDVELLRLGARAVEQLGGAQAALPWFQRLAATGQDRGLGHYRLGEYFLSLGEGRQAIDHFARAAEAGHASPKLAHRQVQAAFAARDPVLARKLLPLLPLAEMAEAEREIQSLEARGQAIENAKAVGRLRSVSSNQLKAWAASRGLQPGRRGRSDLFVSDDGDMLGEHMPNSRAAVLVFGGLKDMLGESLPKFDKAIRAHKVSTLYLSDPRRLLLLAGAPSFGSYAETVAGLRALLEAWEADRVYCMGLSAGGYPAILYGLELDARRILTMAAPTTLVGPVAEADGRARIVMNRIQAEVENSRLDLRERLEATSNPPPIINYYGADSPPDIRHALHLQGLPTVSLRPLEGVVGHNVFAALRTRGDYQGVLNEFLADAGD